MLNWSFGIVPLLGINFPSLDLLLNTKFKIRIHLKTVDFPDLKSILTFTTQSTNNICNTILFDPMIVTIMP